MSVQELVAAGERLGLRDAELRAWVDDVLAAEREASRQERESARVLLELEEKNLQLRLRLAEIRKSRGSGPTAGHAPSLESPIFNVSPHNFISLFNEARANPVLKHCTVVDTPRADECNAPCESSHAQPSTELDNQLETLPHTELFDGGQGTRKKDTVLVQGQVGCDKNMRKRMRGRTQCPGKMVSTISLHKKLSEAKRAKSVPVDEDRPKVTPRVTGMHKAKKRMVKLDRKKFKRRALKIKVQAKRCNTDSASREVPSEPFLWRVHKRAQKIARKRKDAEEPGSRWLVAEPLSRDSCLNCVTGVSTAGSKNQTDSLAKGAEWKRRKKVKMKPQSNEAGGKHGIDLD